jgi:AcrR family transcriptional regulator
LSQQASLQAYGLRERKKVKTRLAIQNHALRLFREQGYEETTVEQIAEEAEVSESTFFRYFPTKADVVMWDNYDPLIVEAFRQQPPELSPIRALRCAFHDGFEQLSSEEQAEQRERTSLVFSVPELRAAMLDQFASSMGLLAEVVAERTGRPPDDLAVRTLAGAVIGAMMAVMVALHEHPDADFAELVDEVMGNLEAGFSL